ncbi:15-hydroxyprostaglandin dehydrogenase [NAD(+)] isoform X2 [Leptinotarsa decemlineata]|uniref:15-hydroxyprostaglandin dehydrogenase [NAD(+)] isoform X2 n=1 Tax=Leptinotarsa decemlineata TaxID=7539 RepID=UPI003D306782
MVFNLQGKVALITGGARGLGFQFAKELLKNGVRGITISDCDPVEGSTAAETLNKEFGRGKVIFIKTDVTDKKQFEEAFQKTVEVFNNVDILINNAGIMNDAIWEEEIAVNVNGVVHGMLLGFDKYLKNFKSDDEAVILNMSSVGGIKGYGHVPVYVATKFAVTGMVKSWSYPTHYERTKVRVIGLCPGATDTTLQVMEGKYIGPEYEDSIKDIPVEQFVIQPAEFVASEMVKLLMNSKNGTMWVVEGSKPAYEYIIPERETFKNNRL